ncbi:site-2 protease family protein [Candidatus Woesearchaeota archaeon]|nr:site-2 protease family protein [Candidatus Woesearchaeota archaeon]
MSFLYDNRYALLFYGLIILLLIINRKKFEIHAKIIALYKTKIGIRLMDKWAEKYKGFVQIFGYSGIGVGFATMVFVVLMLMLNLYNLVTKPDAVSGVSPVVPGLQIPGSGIFVPLVIGWIALFIIIVVHEFAHGVVARAHDVKVKSSGLLFFGPIMGAFVEPDEKELAKKDPSVQYSIFAAGSFSNIILAFFVFVLLLGIVPLKDSMTEPIGFSIGGLVKDFPAEKSGLKAGDIVIGINGKEIKIHDEFQKEYQFTRPGEEVTIKTSSGSYTIKTIENEKDGRAMVGISNLKDEVRLKNKSSLHKIIYSILIFIEDFLKWTYVLALGIGVINLLPLGPIDGGRMMKTALEQIMKDKRKALVVFSRITAFSIIILALNIFYPGLKFLGGKIF